MGLPNKDELEGKYEQAKGTVKEKWGQATDDPATESEGRADRAKGEVQEGVGRARRKVGEAIEDIGEKVGK